MPRPQTVGLLLTGGVLAIGPPVCGDELPSAEELHQRLEARLAEEMAGQFAPRNWTHPVCRFWN